jgi:hypothetical protein
MDFDAAKRVEIKGELYNVLTPYPETAHLTFLS